MLEKSYRENQGWTIKCHARKDGASVREDSRKLGETRRVRKTLLRSSMLGVNQAKESETSIPGRRKNMCKHLAARLNTEGLRNWEFNVI